MRASNFEHSSSVAALGQSHRETTNALCARNARASGFSRRTSQCCAITKSKLTSFSRYVLQHVTYATGAILPTILIHILMCVETFSQPRSPSQIATNQIGVITTYEDRAKLLDELTEQALLLQLKAVGKLAPWESNSFARLSTVLCGKKLQGRSSQIDGFTRTWKGPTSFTYWDPNIGERGAYHQVFMRPPPSTDLHIFLLPLYESGGITVFAGDPPKCQDVLIGSNYWALGCRILESLSKPIQIKAFGDDTVYRNQPKQSGGVTGFAFPTSWLGQQVWFVVTVPFPGPAVRSRLNPETGEGEVLEYTPLHWFEPSRIISATEITEFQYGEGDVEQSRTVFKNVGHWNGIEPKATFKKGEMLRSSRTLELFLPDDVMQRKVIREWTNSRTGEKTTNTYTLQPDH